MDERTEEGRRLFREVVKAAGELADVMTTPDTPPPFVTLREQTRRMIERMLVVANENGDEPTLVGAVSIMELVIKTADAAMKNEELTATGLQRVIEVAMAVAVQRIDELTRV